MDLSKKLFIFFIIICSTLTQAKTIKHHSCKAYFMPQGHKFYGPHGHGYYQPFILKPSQEVLKNLRNKGYKIIDRDSANIGHDLNVILIKERGVRTLFTKPGMEAPYIYFALLPERLYNSISMSISRNGHELEGGDLLWKKEKRIHLGKKTGRVKDEDVPWVDHTELENKLLKKVPKCKIK